MKNLVNVLAGKTVKWLKSTKRQFVCYMNSNKWYIKKKKKSYDG